MSKQFPTDIYQQLDGIDFRILDELAFLAKQQQKRTGSAYCCPGREYLASKAACDVGTISRHTTKLERLGLIEKVQRRPIGGIWQTCLYKLKSWVTWRLGQIAASLRKLGQKRSTDNSSHRVRLDARIASVRTEIETSPQLQQPKHPPEPPPPLLSAEEIAKKDPLLAKWLNR